MALDADPYRTLGLARGASREEVKRAYRALAKVHHPDAAGETALPRFLAIQAAYEQLIDGSIPPRGRGSAAARKPWEADDDRSDATRRAYGARPRGPRPSAGAGPAGAGPASARPAGGSPGGGGPRPGRSPGGGRASGSGSGAGGTGSERDAPPGTPGGPPGARSTGGTRGAADPPNKATLGSTSYDGVDPARFEPDWDDASWYGTSSGTYWTLNPKEYADPRKHGPEYQARARRSAQARAEAVAAASAAAPTPASAASAAQHRPAAPPVAADPATVPGVPNDTQGPSHTTTSWWDSTAGPAGTPPQPDPRPRPATPRPATWPATPPRATPRPPTIHQALPVPDLGAAATQLGRALIDERTGGHRARIVRAVIGWLPITLGLGWFVGELSGCSRFAASCDGTTQPFLLALQVAALLVLVVVPFLASIASMAALTAFIVALMVSLVITATGSAADGDSRQATLGVLVVIAWAFGLAFAIAGRVRALVGRAGPVS